MHARSKANRLMALARQGGSSASDHSAKAPGSEGQQAAAQNLAPRRYSNKTSQELLLLYGLRVMLMLRTN